LKRSNLTSLIADAKALAASYHRVLPSWSNWGIADYVAKPDVARYVKNRQMGWDVTDFGGSNFDERGLLLFCLRNGIQGNPTEKPYAEKMLVVGEMQETPFHLHHVKLEDIINCGGGNLMIEFLYKESETSSPDRPITVKADGETVVLAPREPLRLHPGQSVTVERGIYHRFYAEAGAGPCLGWEVSQVNDDFTDNYFLEDGGRFSSVEEDAPIVHPLWHEVPVGEEKTL
jgi:D-lyxose ketol-isomerase